MKIYDVLRNSPSKDRRAVVLIITINPMFSNQVKAVFVM
jgi:hypothetical protein